MSYTFEEAAERWLLSALKTTEEAEKLFNRQSNRPPEVERIKELIDEASDQLKQAIGNDHEAAVQEAGQTVYCTTVSARLLKLAGNVLASKGTPPENQREGINAYNQYLKEFEPNDVQVLLLLAEAYLRVDEYDKAEAALRRVLEEDATNRRADKLLRKLPKFANQDRSTMQTIPVPQSTGNSLQPFRQNAPLQGEIIHPGAVCHNCGHPQPASAQRRDHDPSDHMGTALMFLVVFAFIAIMLAFVAGALSDKNRMYNQAYRQPRQIIPCHNQDGEQYYCIYDDYGELRRYNG